MLAGSCREDRFQRALYGIPDKVIPSVMLSMVQQELRIFQSEFCKIAEIDTTDVRDAVRLSEEVFAKWRKIKDEEIAKPRDGQRRGVAAEYVCATDWQPLDLLRFERRRNVMRKFEHGDTSKPADRHGYSEGEGAR
jgi:hypothetical protein